MGERSIEDDVFPDHLNEVEVHFRNGDTMKVDTVLRMQGADWLTASIMKPHEDSSEETAVVWDSVVLHSDDIRAIRSRYVTSPPESEVRGEWRIHSSVKLSESEQRDLMHQSWEGQHHLHPDDDPTAYPESEERWPPRGQDDFSPQQARKRPNSDD